MSGPPAPAFGGELIAVALLCTVTRPDGVKIGLTSLDTDFERGDLVYASAPGIVPSAIELGSALETSTAAIEGALSSWQISGADLAMGRWFGAEIRLMAVDWADGRSPPVPLARGAIGTAARSVIAGNDQFQMEFLSPSERLARSGPPRCSPMCRARFGDARCAVDLERHEHLGVIATAAERRVRLDGIAIDDALLRDGTLRFLDGPMAGVDRAIVAAGDGWLTLDADLVAGELPGSRVRVREGCDHRFATCVERFGNGLNFDGEPHVPGDDLLLRYGDL